MQDKSKLGNRFSCYGCGKKFYDLNRPEPVCPGCGANQHEDPTPDPRVAVMARYKGSRLTAEDTAPSKAAFTVEDTAPSKAAFTVEDTESAEYGEGAESDASSEDYDDLEDGPVFEPDDTPST